MEKRTHSWLLAAFITAGIFFTGVSYADELFGPVSVTTESINLLPAEHGYIEHRIRITNRALDRTYQVTLVLPDKSFTSGYTNYIHEIRRTVTVSPSSSVLVCLAQPPLSIYGNGNISVFINGKVAGTFIYNFQSYYPQHSSAPKVLISRNLNSEILEDTFQKTILGAEIKRTPKRGGGAPFPRPIGPPFPESAVVLARAEMDVAGWSENWLAYSSFDGIVVSGEDIQRMPASVRLALLRYAECGGTLLVMGSFDVPAPWNKRGYNAPYGMEAFYAGFGICILAPEKSPETLDKDQVFFLKSEFDKTRKPWLAMKIEESANNVLPVVEKIGIPVRPFFSVLLGIAILIGPANLFVLHRKKKHIWVLWTTPLISLVATISIVLYSLLSEGITPTIRIENLTILDQVSRKATSVGVAGYYFPFTQFGGLHAGYDTECSPQVNRHSSSPHRRPYVLDWTYDQYLESGWVVPRMPVHLMIRKSEGRRERLETRQNGRTLSIVNGLGADIEELWLADREGRVYNKAGIKAGTEAVIEMLPGNLRAQGNPEMLRNLYQGEWAGIYASVTKDYLRLLSPDTYIAVFETCPFIEKSMTREGKERYRSVVFGILN